MTGLQKQKIELFSETLPLAFTNQAEQQVLRLDRDAPELAGFVAREEENPTRPFCIAFEHPRASPPGWQSCPHWPSLVAGRNLLFIIRNTTVEPTRQFHPSGWIEGGSEGDRPQIRSARTP